MLISADGRFRHEAHSPLRELGPVVAPRYAMLRFVRPRMIAASPYEARLLRPRMVPRVMRFILRFMGKPGPA